MNTAAELDSITEILAKMPESVLQEVRDFAFYLADRERRRNALIKRVQEAEASAPTRYDSVDDAVNAVFDEV
ncbi:MAG: hypothetical protein HQL10_06325 [Nitrospirae bacterium]|nr:hypothetical protein [Nitrospirota bacterium]